ncbi:MAG: transposase [Chitinophagaceae bacterium]|nr:MAG: transposase [Chitinophagaceae bacterium]
MSAKVLKSDPKKSFRQAKQFSETVKKQTVKDIEQGKCTVLEASRELLVSMQSVYKWVYKYSGYLHKNKVMVVEQKSEGYQTRQLEIQLRQTEAALGRKQLELDFLNKLVELAGAELGVDLKKNFSGPALNGSVPTREQDTL